MTRNKIEEQKLEETDSLVVTCPQHDGKDFVEICDTQGWKPLKAWRYRGIIHHKVGTSYNYVLHLCT